MASRGNFYYVKNAIEDGSKKCGRIGSKNEVRLNVERFTIYIRRQKKEIKEYSMFIPNNNLAEKEAIL